MSQVDNPGTCAVAFIDFDYDTDQDIITASCSLTGAFDSNNPGTLVGIPGPIRLFKNTFNETGSADFVDVTSEIFPGIGDGFWMGISMADLNSDGKIDFYIGNGGVSVPHLLLVSQPDGTYVNQSVSSGLAFHEFNWGSAFLDLNNDGEVDLVTVGALDAAPVIPIRNPGRIFLNAGNETFAQAGEMGLSALLTSGLSVADFDEDGSQDFIVVGTKVTSPPEAVEVFTDPGRLVLFRGTARKDRHVSFILRGTESNKAGIGASVQVCPDADTVNNKERQVEKLACQQRVATAGSSFASTHSPILHFGVPEGVDLVNVVVSWPSAQRDVHTQVNVGFRYILTEGADDLKVA